MNNRLFACGFVLLICAAGFGIARSTVVVSSSGSRAVPITTQCRFNPDGYFYLKESAPEGFETFDHIELVTAKGSGDDPPADSHLYTKDGRAYKFTKLGRFQTHASGSGIVFEFETETVKGVSYKFRGRFISICVFAQDETDPKKAVAEGRLTKTKGDRTAASAPVEFTYSKAERPRS